MKKIVRLTENDISRIVRRVIEEEKMTQQIPEDWYRKKNNRIRLNEDATVEKIRSCYSNSNKPFPTSCEKGLHSVCRQKIRDTATSFFINNNNAMYDKRISKFWTCINNIDKTILQGMG